MEYTAPAKKPDPEMLSKIEVKHMLSQKFVDWEHLHTDLLVTIYENRATSKSVAGKRTAQMTDARFKLFHDLSRQLPTFLSNASEGKVEQWVSGVYSLAIDFARLLDDRLIKGEGDLLEKIESVLEGDWSPELGEHEETIYYLAGYVLRTIHNKSLDERVGMREHFAGDGGQAVLPPDGAC